ncbi:MAG TPA: hypothetical protein VE912_04175 [Bacteroidales bacterium]|nr:hypothetical protein [Bacteroidales bacterium]
MKKGIIICFLFVVGCSTAKYIPPSKPEKPQFSKTIASGYDKTWDAIINHVSSTFFSIENFEKESGLIIVTFGSNDPSQFIDCGTHHVKVRQNYQTKKYDGPYENFVVNYENGSFVGRMNITAKKISDNKTRVRVNAKYVLSDNLGHTWNFESGSSASQKMQNTIAKNKIRKCYPTYKAENSILNAVQKLAQNKN